MTLRIDNRGKNIGRTQSAGSEGLWLFPMAVVLTVVLGAIAGRCEAAPDASRPPNVVLIFCDDLGYGDIGCFGSTKHRTPHVDRMAREGVRFTSFYVTAGVCSPSRSSLMTGCYPRRVNLHQNEKGRWVLFPANSRGLHPDEITIAEVLKQRGYATCCVGKWHLGDQPRFLPTRQGFDHYFGIPYSNDMGKVRPRSKYPPLPLLRDDKVIETEPDQAQLTPRYTAEAIKFITANRDRPFFLYLPHTFPHWPLHASERFLGKSANGAFGDAVEEIDWSTGEILATLRRLGLDEQTLVIFTSDNGAARQHGGSNSPLRGFKGSTFEGGMRVPFVARWPKKIPAGKSSNALVTSMDLLPTLAKLAGGQAPTDRKIDGRDIWSLLASADGAESPHEAFFYYRIGTLQAVRSGQWKLNLASGELYDLHADIAESKNLAAQHPEVVEKLSRLAEACREDLGDGRRQGKNQRPAGAVDNPVPLGRSDS